MPTMCRTKAVRSPRSVTDVDRVFDFVAAQVDFDQLKTPSLVADGVNDNDVRLFSSVPSIVQPRNNSISSLSLSASGSESFLASPRRSIFGSYWKKNERGDSLSSVASVTDTASSNGRGAEDVNSYEQVLERSESAGARKSTNSGSRRRRIWSNHVPYSMPDLMTSSVSTVSCTKSKSASALHRTLKPSSSCLRESRYSQSGCFERLLERAPSVRFSGKDDVVHLEYRMENWAEDGWSEWFK